MKVLWVLLLAGIVVPASTLAAAPGNDNFESRQVLNGALSIEQIGSNVGATSEAGETVSGQEAGHSVWFEWEAPSSGWFTIGACDSNFAAIVGVFTGTEVSNLVRVVSGTAAEGPDCPNQRQYTFRANGQTDYVVRVDGQFIPIPEGPSPPVVGNFTLAIEKTSPPPNDTFANAIPLEAPVTAEPGGNRFYGLFTRGYNWEATTEPGEFPYGTNSGASVWYRWTPPESGTYRLSGPCCGEGLNLALFSGGFGAENEILAATGFAEVTLGAGNPYWISIYGTPQMEATEPSMASFGLFISAALPPLPPTRLPAIFSGPSSDTTPPETMIDRSTLRVAARMARFWFSSSEPAQRFFCRLDRGDFKPCGSPRTYKRLKAGRHAFRVKAVDTAGNVDGSAAVAHFKIPRPSQRRAQPRGGSGDEPGPNRTPRVD
jgi:hypothetical protein